MSTYIVTICQHGESVKLDVIAESTVDAIMNVLRALPANGGAFAISGRPS